ncbi:hypothetical protein BDL97_04G021100 [Sphagnum fallax]|nr:hypothetical protein BDL97_04G021100 [Sphagnum fallax]
MKAGLMSEPWEQLWLVFAWLDGKSLATACCVSKQWQHIASHDDFWRPLCDARWPSALSTDAGARAVRTVGTYRLFYSLRSQAQRYSSVPRPRPEQTNLRMEDLLFFLDIAHGDSGAPLFSFVRGGEELVAAAPAGDRFRFVIDIPPPEMNPQRQHNKIPAGDRGSEQNAMVSARDAGNITAVPRTHGSWTKQQVKELKVSWAVMLKGSPKVLQIVETKGGQMVSNACNFSQCLPEHGCCPVPAAVNHQAEIDLHFSYLGRDSTSNAAWPMQNIWEATAAAVAATRQVEEHNLDHVSQYTIMLREIHFGFLITSSWRYFTQLQAMKYLEHAFIDGWKLQ